MSETFKAYKAKLRRRATIRKQGADLSSCPNCGGHNVVPWRGDYMECRDCGYDWDQSYEQYQHEIGEIGEMYDSLDALQGLPTTPHPTGQE